MVRTRVAPSPTGYPHIGTMYQALFDYAFAKKHGGSFIVRIEDTDRARFVEGAETKIFEALDWFGFHEDESVRNEKGFGPYRQSERLELYRQHALELIQKGHAYYCFCAKERLDEVRKRMQAEGKVPMYDGHCKSLSQEEVDANLHSHVPYVVRIRIPDSKTIVVNDLIRGDISFDSNIITDQVLLKADGFPTYHLAVVVDDHYMKVTHVVRGEEWIPTSPIHILLYEFFGWDRPVFFHTPILRNPDKSKLSKRHGHTNVTWYQQQGYLPDAIRNYLALMGWSHPEQKEIFTMDEFIRLFDLKDVKPVAPTFDLGKLDWMNGEYIRAMTNEELSLRIHSFIGASYDMSILEQSVPIAKERIKKLADYMPLCEFLYQLPESYDIDLSEYKSLIAKMAAIAEQVPQWNADAIGAAMQELAKNEKVKNSVFFMVLRVAVSGKKITPPLNESMHILGKNEVVQRLRKLV